MNILDAIRVNGLVESTADGFKFPDGTIQTTANAGGGSGSVTTVSVVSANGFGGSVANPSTTPAITVTMNVNGLVKGNGTAISAAVVGTDYSAGTSALATGLLKNTTGTGALSIAAAGTDYLAPNGSGTGLTGVELTANKDASGGYAGLTLFKINFKNAANTITSFFTNTNTVARTYTFPNKSMTVADDADVASKQASNTNLTNLSGLTSVADAIPYFSSSSTMSTLPSTSTGQTLLNSADASAGRTTLGLGTIATQAASSVAVTGGTINATTLGATTRASAQVTTLDANNDITISVAGKGLKVKSGSNAKIGTATLSGGTVVVSTTAVTANSMVILTNSALGTISVPSALSYTKSAGASFTITSASASDTSTIDWMIVERT